MGASASTDSSEAGEALHQLAQQLPNTQTEQTQTENIAETGTPVKAAAVYQKAPVPIPSSVRPPPPAPKPVIIYPKPTAFFNSPAPAASADNPFPSISHALVSWLRPLFPVDLTLAWHEELLKGAASKIAESEELAAAIKKRQAERRQRKKEGNTAKLDDPVFTAELLSIDRSPPGLSINIPYEIAASLLQFDKKLAALRLSVVPSRINEAIFWFEYFLIVGRLVAKQVAEANLAIKQKDIN